MKITLLITILLSIIGACSLLNSCCSGGVSYEGRFATYTVDEEGKIIIEPHIHAAK